MLGRDVDDRQLGHDHRFEKGEVERLLVRPGQCHLDFKKAVGLGDEALPGSRVSGLNAGEVLLSIVLSGDKLPSIAGFLGVLVDEVLVRDPVECGWLLGRCRITECAQRECQRRETLLAIHNEVGR